MAKQLLSSIDLSVSQTYALDSVQIWTEAVVKQWLIDIGMGKFADAFEDNNISGDILADIKHEHLRDMGIGVIADRMRLLILIKRLRKESVTRKRMYDLSLGRSSTGTGGLRVDTQVGSRSVSGNVSGALHSASAISNKTASTATKTPLGSSIRSISRFNSSGTIGLRSKTGEDISLKRLIRVYSENFQSRIIDVTGVTTMRQTYAKILHRLGIVDMSEVTTTAKLDRESQKWELVYVVQKREGRPVTEDDISSLGMRDSSTTVTEDSIPRFIFRIKPVKPTQKISKLEKVLGHSFGSKPTPTASKGVDRESRPKVPGSPPPAPSHKLESFFGNVPPQELTGSRHHAAIAPPVIAAVDGFDQRPASQIITKNLTKYFPAAVDNDDDDTLGNLILRKQARVSNKASALKPSPSKPPNEPLPEIPQVSTPPSSENRSPGSQGFKWSKGQLIGTGSFGNVYLGLNGHSGEIFAVKQVALPSTEDESQVPSATAKVQSRRKQMVEALQREISLLKDLEHPNIVQYLGSESTDVFLNIFLEYVPGGSISSALASYGVFEEGLIKNYVKQILAGLSYLHRKNIVHRDIKSANILIDNTGAVKITDFGISKKISDGNDRGSVISLYANPAKRTSALQGSVFWMSPEVVKDYHYSKKSDVWSLGCVILEMMTGTHPWPDLSQMQALYKIGSGEAAVIPSDVSPILESFLERCFVLNYRERPDADALLGHEFLAAST